MIVLDRVVLDLSNPIDESKIRYAMSDLNSVYTHYDAKIGKNIPTPNKLKEVPINVKTKTSK